MKVSRGSFVIEINGDYLGVTNASVPANCCEHYSLLSDINHYIISMRRLGISADVAYHATNLLISAVKGLSCIEAR